MVLCWASGCSVLKDCSVLSAGSRSTGLGLLELEVLQSFEVSGATCPAVQCQIAEDLNACSWFD